MEITVNENGNIICDGKLYERLFLEEIPEDQREPEKTRGPFRECHFCGKQFHTYYRNLFMCNRHGLFTYCKNEKCKKKIKINKIAESATCDKICQIACNFQAGLCSNCKTWNAERDQNCRGRSHCNCSQNFFNWLNTSKPMVEQARRQGKSNVSKKICPIHGEATFISGKCIICHNQKENMVKQAREVGYTLGSKNISKFNRRCIRYCKKCEEITLHNMQGRCLKEKPIIDTEKLDKSNTNYLERRSLKLKSLQRQAITDLVTDLKYIVKQNGSLLEIFKTIVKIYLYEVISAEYFGVGSDFTYLENLRLNNKVSLEELNELQEAELFKLAKEFNERRIIEFRNTIDKFIEKEIFMNSRRIDKLINSGKITKIEDLLDQEIKIHYNFKEICLEEFNVSAKKPKEFDKHTMFKKIWEGEEIVKEKDNFYLDFRSKPVNIKQLSSETKLNTEFKQLCLHCKAITPHINSKCRVCEIKDIVWCGYHQRYESYYQNTFNHLNRYRYSARLWTKENPYEIESMNITKPENLEIACVYGWFVKDKNGKDICIYIGETTNLKYRMLEHMYAIFFNPEYYSYDEKIGIELRVLQELDRSSFGTKELTDELKSSELEWIDKLQPWSQFCNGNNDHVKPLEERNNIELF